MIKEILDALFREPSKTVMITESLRDPAGQFETIYTALRELEPLNSEKYFSFYSPYRIESIIVQYDDGTEKIEKYLRRPYGFCIAVRKKGNNQVPVV